MGNVGDRSEGEQSDRRFAAALFLLLVVPFLFAYVYAVTSRLYGNDLHVVLVIVCAMLAWWAVVWLELPTTVLGLMARIAIVVVLPVFWLLWVDTVFGLIQTLPVSTPLLDEPTRAWMYGHWIGFLVMLYFYLLLLLGMVFEAVTRVSASMVEKSRTS